MSVRLWLTLGLSAIAAAAVTIGLIVLLTGPSPSPGNLTGELRAAPAPKHATLAGVRPAASLPGRLAPVARVTPTASPTLAPAVNTTNATPAPTVTAPQLPVNTAAPSSSKHRSSGSGPTIFP